MTTSEKEKSLRLDPYMYIKDSLTPLAKEIGEDPDDLTSRYIEAVSAADLDVQIYPLDGPKEAALAGTIHKEFDLTVVPAVLSLKIVVDVQTGSDWKASLTVTPRVFGHSLDPSRLTLSHDQYEISIRPGIAVAKLDPLTLGLYGPKLCFGVSGKACYWALKWHCKDFEKKDIFCIL